MAKRRYRPYRTRKQESRRQMRNIMLALIVLAVGVFILVKTSNKNNEPEGVDENDIRPISEILPETETETPSAEIAEAEPEFNPPASESEPVESPAAVAEEPIVETVQEPSVVQTPPADSGTTSPEAQELIDKANELRGNGKIIAARDLLNHTLDLKLSAVVRAAVKERLAKLADVWLFGRDVYESDKLTSYYLVQSGDLLAVIAKRYKVPYEALMRINDISRPELLQAGTKIKVIDGPFNAVIYKSSFTMDLYLQNVYIKTYRVGLGTIDHETPSGRWRVKRGGKLISPRWTDPDTGKVYVGSAPDYPLGSRWIAIEGLDEDTKDRTGFAIHGTKDPESIGTRSSRGCIRLYNGDAIELYNLLQEGLSEVLVVE
ncbi:MAG: L,D-transpeptidase family protein [Phycisphaerae bacterium]|nr:L,D-transpeptidase family protein [Phycisphaerae bacterium]